MSDFCRKREKLSSSNVSCKRVTLIFLSTEENRLLSCSLYVFSIFRSHLFIQIYLKNQQCDLFPDRWNRHTHINVIYFPPPTHTRADFNSFHSFSRSLEVVLEITWLLLTILPAVYILHVIKSMMCCLWKPLKSHIFIKVCSVYRLWCLIVV